MQDDYTDVQQSYGRCLQSGHFIDRFYEIFNGKPAADGAERARWHSALRHGIAEAILFAGGNHRADATVALTAQRSRGGRAEVEPKLYDSWLDSLLQAVREHDPQLTPTLEERWRSALEKVIDLCMARY